jgi:hypothetical protein
MKNERKMLNKKPGTRRPFARLTLGKKNDNGNMNQCRRHRVVGICPQ